jgi:hypothetical protein
MAAIPLLETETKQICPVCGKEHSGKFDHKINGDTHKGVCFSCIKKVIINKWSDRWVQLEEAHEDETLKMKLLKFHEFYLTVTLEEKIN